MPDSRDCYHNKDVQLFKRNEAQQRYCPPDLCLPVLNGIITYDAGVLAHISLVTLAKQLTVSMLTGIPASAVSLHVSALSAAADDLPQDMHCMPSLICSIITHVPAYQVLFGPVL